VGLDQLDDQDYPALTVGKAAELLGVQPAFLRSLDTAGVVSPQRSLGGHRRYSRRQLARAARMRELFDQGHTLASAAQVLALEDDLVAARDERDLAHRQREEAREQRDEARDQRDQAYRQRDQAYRQRDEARQERDQVYRELGQVRQGARRRGAGRAEPAALERREPSRDDRASATPAGRTGAGADQVANA
jgi:MerR family transcriptional regulator/heat shock protein HspR